MLALLRLMIMDPHKSGPFIILIMVARAARTMLPVPAAEGRAVGMAAAGAQL